MRETTPPRPAVRRAFRHAVRLAAGISAVAVLAAGCGSSAPTPSPSLAGPTPTPWTPVAVATTTVPPTPSASPTPIGIAFPIAVVTRYDDARPNISVESLTTAEASGSILVPCEVMAIALNGAPMPFVAGATCLPAADIAKSVLAKAGTLALLPPGLVVPEVKVLPIGDADLFGSPMHRALPYPLVAWTANAAPWTAYDASNVRTIISTGDTCPDRGVSHQAVVAGKGWDWVLGGGTVTYSRFVRSVTHSLPVPVVTRTGNDGAVAALISDNDIGVNDFECAMVTHWTQHDVGMHFDVDPAVAQLLAVKGGVKTVTLGSNHITDAGIPGIRETEHYLDAAGIGHTGAGSNLADALKPSVVEVRGVRFAFVGWNDGSQKATATASAPGVATMTHDNVCNSIKAARAMADVVIAEPQWGHEYHNEISVRQAGQMKWIYGCGADGILGSGTHWASWAQITQGPNGPRFAIGSHGNFLFDQNWSRQTMEAVIVEVTFVGTKLVQFRLHPYVIVDDAQPNLTNSATDGKYVLNQVWSVGGVK